MEKGKKLKYMKNCRKLKSGDLIYCHNDVLVNPEGEDNKFYVGKVKKFNGNKAHISRYYMPEETAFGRLPFQGKNEILYSDHTDELSIDAIEKSCKVHSEDDPKRFQEEVEADVYLCRSGYDPVKREFTKDTKFFLYCTCRLPYNPDVPMIQCETCKSWFHPPCVGINTKAELDKIMTLSCKHANSSAS